MAPIIDIIAQSPVTVVAGHYGVGKTNLALNIALDAKEAGYEVTLVDLDVVNPYFRSSEYASELRDAGVELVAPVFALAGSNLDVPSLSPMVSPAIRLAHASFAQGGLRRVIIDAGGDDVGATALGRFAPDITCGPYQFAYVVNRYRNLTQDVDEALDVLGQIEGACHLKATCVVNNSHLKDATTLRVVEDAIGFGRDVALAVHLPLVATTVPVEIVDPDAIAASGILGASSCYPVRSIVRTPWE